MTPTPTPDQTPPPSRPLTLLAVEGDGTLAAAWTVTAPTPAAALIMLGEIAGFRRADPAGLAGYARNPARWRVHDRAPDPAAFWAALDAGQIGGPPGTPGRAPAPVIHPAVSGGSYVRQLASGMGTPPAGLPMADRARWVAQYALLIQVPLMAHPGLVFHGQPGQMPGTGNVSITTAGGGFLAPLANTGYARSPSGFGWGGGTLGSGPAALAKALLTAALGRYAACPGCAGTGRVTYADSGDPAARPWRPEDGTAGAADCLACDHDGIGIPPGVYHAYAAAQVAALPEEGEWRLTRADVLAWLEHQTGDGRLAWLARSVER
jgi:hypothetical protein